MKGLLAQKLNVSEVFVYICTVLVRAGVRNDPSWLYLFFKGNGWNDARLPPAAVHHAAPKSPPSNQIFRFLPVSSPLFWVISFRYHLWCTTSLHLAGFTGKQHWIVICSNFKATYFTSSKTSGMSRCWRNNTTLHDVLCLETWMDACILLYWPMDEWSRQKHEDIVASAFLPLSHKSLQFKFGNEQNITKLPRGLGLGMLRAHPKTFSISPWSAPQNWDLLSPERP